MTTINHIEGIDDLTQALGRMLTKATLQGIAEELGIEHDGTIVIESDRARLTLRPDGNSLETWSEKRGWRVLRAYDHHTPLDQATRATRAAARSAIAYAKGQRITVSTEEEEERRQTCEACPYLDAERFKCNACGCSKLGLKLTLATEDCPKGRWG